MNNVSFSTFGAMCYPLKSPLQAKHLPWYDFQEMGLVIVTYNNKFGHVEEAMVDMDKIRKARKIMTEQRICPFANENRSFYRFCDESNIPFSNENMLYLRNSLQNPDRPSFPKNLRTVDTLQVHNRMYKTIQVQEFENWIESGYTISSIIFNAYKLQCLKMEHEDCESELFDNIKCHVQQCNADNNNNNQQRQQSIRNESTVNDLQADVNVTTKYIITYATKEKWIYIYISI